MKIYVGDIGTKIDLNADPNATGVDLTGYTVSILFKKPDGSEIARVAALKPGSTTIVRYTTVANDINLAGTWKAQIKVAIGSNTWKGETISFVVYDAFN